MKVRPALTVLSIVLLLAPPGLAASTGGGASSGSSSSSEAPRGGDEAALLYDRGVELVKEGRFQEALERFRKAAEKDEKNPEYLNMVAYTQRKIGNLDDAFETYHRVLAIKPDFPQAREYLGEAHLQALLLQIEVLRGYGDDARPYHDQLVAALREAAETLEAEPMGGTIVAPDKKGW